MSDLSVAELKAQLDRLQHLKRRAQKLKRLLKKAEEARDDLQAELHLIMGQAEFDTINTSVARYERRRTMFGVIYDMDAFEAWCAEHGESEAYLRIRPESARINELVRFLDQNKEPMPPGVSSYHREYISVTDNRKDDS